MSVLTDLFVGLVERLVLPRLDPLARYPATVASQNEDGSLDVRPDDPRFGPGLTRVPVRHGIPGVSVRVRSGARVMLAFEGGDTSRPYVPEFEGGLESITIKALGKVVVEAPEVFLADEEGAQPLARVGDLIEVALPPLTPFTGTVVPAPPGSPVAGTLTFVETAQGYITSGSERARSR